MKKKRALQRVNLKLAGKMWPRITFFMCVKWRSIVYGRRRGREES